MLRIFLLACLVVGGLVIGVFSGFIPEPTYSVLARRWHRAVIWILGVRLTYCGEAGVDGEMLVGNHVSWLDIAVTGARLPIVFLANQEIAHWPVLGFVIRRSGTLFIRRGEGAANAIESISGSLARGQSVMLFPEGGTTDGFSTAKFQPRLLQAALNTGATVRPVSIRYLDKYGAATDKAGYVGETTFFESLWRIACCSGLQARITIFAALHDVQNRDECARKAELIIRNDIESNLTSSKRF